MGKLMSVCPKQEWFQAQKSEVRTHGRGVLDSRSDPQRFFFTLIKGLLRDEMVKRDSKEGYVDGLRQSKIHKGFCLSQLVEDRAVSREHNHDLRWIFGFDRPREFLS